MASDQFHEKLYRRFQTYFDEGEQKRAWNPYRDVPWDKINRETPEGLAIAAETFLGVESFLPDYVRKGLEAVRVSSVGQRWFSLRWSYEELKHSMVLTEYLVRSGKRTEEQMLDYQAELMKQEWQRPFDTARQMTIYAVFQEMATFVIYLRHEALAKRHNDEALASCYRLNARDEIAHARFYQDVVRVYLEEDRPGTLKDIAHVAANFRMPGVNIVPDYERRTSLMRGEANMNRDVFLQKVYFPSLKYLGVTRADLVEAGQALRAERRRAKQQQAEQAEQAAAVLASPT